MEQIGRERGDTFARLVGAALIAEALILAATRVFTLIYVVAIQVDAPDSQRLETVAYVPFLLSSVGFVTILAWAGVQMRSAPAGAWREAGLAGRIDLIVAAILNVALAVKSVVGVRSRVPGRGDALVAWLVAGTVALAIVVGLVRDAAGRARPTVE